MLCIMVQYFQYSAVQCGGVKLKCCAVQFSDVQNLWSVVQFQCNILQYNVVLFSVVELSKLWCILLQCCGVQCRIVNYSAVLFRVC